MEPGQRIGRYEIEAPLGAGGMGVVYIARDTELGRRVALKLLQPGPDDGAATRLRREARAAATLDHPHVVTIHDVGESDGKPYIVMELVRGRTLHRLLDDAHISLATRIGWLVDVARALAAAHRAGLVHRDIKPSNVMLRDDGVIKVLDFGIARRASTPSGAPATPSRPDADTEPITEQKGMVGTPRYASPEQLRSGKIDGRSDQFSWALMGYELLTGVHPFEAHDPVALIAGILTVNPPAPKPPASLPEEHIPLEVEDVLLRALEKDPDDRFPDIDEAADLLEPFAGPHLRASSPSNPTSDHPRATHPPDTSHPPRTPRDPRTPHTPRTPRGARTPRKPSDPSLTPEAFEASRISHLNALPLHGPRDPGSERRPPRRSRRPLAAAALACTAALALAVLYLLRSRAESARTAAPLTTLHCEAATLRGPDVTPDMAEAIGIGACARLAVEAGLGWARASTTLPASTEDRTEIRVGWTFRSDPHALQVTATRGPRGFDVTLRLGEHTARGAGPAAFDAVDDAVAALAPLIHDLTPAPLTPAEEQLWGTADPTAARAIQRAVGRLMTGTRRRPEPEAKALLAAAPDSPWTELVIATTLVSDTQEITPHRDRALALLEGRHTPIDKALRAAFLGACFRPTNQREATRLAREAYREAPEQPEIATLFACAVKDLTTMDEVVSVAERTSQRDPARSVLLLRTAVDPLIERNLPRDGAFLDRLHALLPESRAWEESITHLLLTGRIDEARASIDLAETLGISPYHRQPFPPQVLRYHLELAAFRPAEARALAHALLASPGAVTSTMALSWIGSTYEVEGRITDAITGMARALDAVRDSEGDAGAWRTTTELWQLALERAAGVKPSRSIDLDRLDAAAESLGAPRYISLVRTETALARIARDAQGSSDAERRARRTLEDLERFATESARGDRAHEDTLLLLTLPLVHALRGPADAAALWQTTHRARFLARRRLAYDAGLALEATGALAEAEAAYRLAQDPLWFDVYAFTAAAARLRLARLLRALGRDAEAAPLEASLAQPWSRADPGLHQRILAAP